LKYNLKVSNENESYLNAKLHALGLSPEDFDAKVWNINSPISWTRFNALIPSDSGFLQKRDILSEQLAKTIFLELVNPKTNQAVNTEITDLLLCIFVFLENSRLNQVKSEYLEDFLEFYLMNRVITKTDGKTVITHRISPRSGGSVKRLFTFFISINRALSIHKIEPILPKGLSDKRLKKALKNVVETISLGDLTYQDWLKGGSFNNLTLDYGKYYIEYASEFFEENFPIALGLQHIISNRGELLNQVVLKDNKNSASMMATLITGKSNTSIKSYSEDIKEQLRQLIKDEFQRVVQPVRVMQHAMSNDVVSLIAHDVGIKVDQERQTHVNEIERLKSLIYLVLSDVDQPRIDEIMLSSNFLVTQSQLIELIGKYTKKIPLALPPTHDYLAKFCKSYYETVDYRYVEKFISRVMRAGLTCVVAFTGWRRSEFGFTLNSISSRVNTDILDQYAIPFRHSVKWHVFKTNGGTQLEREINESTFRFIKSISLIHKPARDCSALFHSTHKNRKDGLDPTCQQYSSNYTATAVVDSWYNFAMFYKPFHEDEINDLGILEAKEKVFSELSRVVFKTSSANKEWLPKYKSHLLHNETDLEPKAVKMLDEYLTDELKELIKSTSDDELLPLTREISTILFEDCNYVTPHALRHMWAEAVYSRFDGDAGWMIRSNFKHISKSMWLAYITDKSNLKTLDRLKVNIASSLMKNWLRNSGSKTAGKYHVYLSRLFRSTAIKSIEDINKSINTLTSKDIISVKANPWGFCVNRVRTSVYAQCASGGEAHPEDATPELCLGCINFITHESNIDYIVAHSWQHIDFLSGEHSNDVPYILKKPSISYLMLARKRIYELASDHPIIEKYDTALKLCI
jgi:hypothetical protein